MSSAEEAVAASGVSAEAPEGAIKFHPNIIVIDGGMNAPKPITLTPEEAKGMGDPEPDADTAAAAERLRHRRLGYCAIKRLFDIAFSLLIIVAFSWLFLLTAIAIKIDDPSGPVFFGQDRVGRDGKRFRMWKFRSMCADAEAKLAELQAKNEKDGPVFKMADDPRITRVGRVIRKTSIDELPQFFNVLIGQIPLRILKMRPEFSAKCMGAFALPAKSSTNKKGVFPQVDGLRANSLLTRQIGWDNFSAAKAEPPNYFAECVSGFLKRSKTVDFRVLKAVA